MQVHGSAVAALALLLAATPAIAGPSMNTGWKTTTLSQPECVEKAKSVMTAIGLERLQASQVSAFAQKGDYSVVIRCIPEKTMVMFVVAGPEAAETQRLIRAVVERF